MLRTFAYVRPASLSEALKQLEERGARLHAGGTDLLGCLRDGVFEAETVVSLAQARRAARDHGRRPTAAAHRRADDDRRDRRASGRRREVSRRSRRRRRVGRQPAAAQPGHHRRQPLPAAALLVLPRRLRLHAQGRRHVLRPRRREPVPLPSSAAAPASSSTRPTRRRRSSRSTRRCASSGRRARASIPLEKFFVLPDEGRDEETVLEPGEIVTEVLLPAAAPGQKSAYRKVRARGSWDFAMAGLAHAVTSKAGRSPTRASCCPAWRRCRGGCRPSRSSLIGQKLDREAHRARRGRGDGRGEAPGAERATRCRSCAASSRKCSVGFPRRSVRAILGCRPRGGSL